MDEKVNARMTKNTKKQTINAKLGQGMILMLTVPLMPERGWEQRRRAAPVGEW
jgi:hypothetical protein